MADILIVEDKQSMRKMLKETFLGSGYTVETAEDGNIAWEKISKKKYSLIISDIKMPDMTGIELLEKMRSENIDSQVILMTAFGTVETAIKAMKLGVFDYIIKPFSLDEMEITVKKALETKILKQENEFFKNEIKTQYDFSSIIGENSSMKEIFELIEQVAPSKTNVLITGESGTGKELIASAIHYNSNRENNPFVKLNCGALSINLVESELFGHIKGAFTGAINNKNGRFILADKGSLFLDEIGEIDPSTQVKLLRVLQEGEFEAVGSDATSKVDVRIIAATNKDLLEEISKNNFREDLFYRLNVISIHLPPLRERGEDVILIAEHFLKKYSDDYGKKIKGFHEEVKSWFLRYDWPGNVRELENIVERAVVLCRNDEIDSSLLPVNIKTASKIKIPENSNMKLPELMDEIEKNLIKEGLEKYHWNQTKTSKNLGLTRSALQYKMQKYDLMRDND